MPDAERASTLERIYWDHVEEITADLTVARADHGHNAVTGMHTLRLKAQLEYSKARAARLADEERAKSSGDAVERIAGLFAKMPTAQQDRLILALTAIVTARKSKVKPEKPPP